MRGFKQKFKTRLQNKLNEVFSNEIVFTLKDANKISKAYAEAFKESLLEDGYAIINGVLSARVIKAPARFFFNAHKMGMDAKPERYRLAPKVNEGFREDLMNMPIGSISELNTFTQDSDGD